MEVTLHRECRGRLRDGERWMGQRHILEGPRQQDAAESATPLPPSLYVLCHMVNFQGRTLVHLRCPQPSKHLLDEEMCLFPDFPFNVKNTKAQTLRKQLKSVCQGQLPAGSPSLPPTHLILPVHRVRQVVEEMAS